MRKTIRPYKPPLRKTVLKKIARPAWRQSRKKGAGPLYQEKGPAPLPHGGFRPRARSHVITLRINRDTKRRSMTGSTTYSSSSSISAKRWPVNRICLFCKKKVKIFRLAACGPCNLLLPLGQYLGNLPVGKFNFLFQGPGRHAQAPCPKIISCSAPSEVATRTRWRPAS